MAKVIWILELLTAVAASPAIAESTESCTPEDYAIFSAALNELHGKNSETVLILDQTSTGLPPGMAATTSGGPQTPALLRDVPKALKDDFDRRNKARAHIEEDKLKVHPNVVVLNSEEGDKLLETGHTWENLHSKYPKASGLTLLSLPGINTKGNAALLYVANSCGALCGRGVLLFLGKAGTRWKVLNRAIIWES